MQHTKQIRNEANLPPLTS